MSLTVRRLRRVSLIVLAALAALVIIGLGALYALSESRINHTHVVPEPHTQLARSTDATTIREGERLASTRGCAGCHGEDLAGRMLMDVDGFAYMKLAAPNLTRGMGGVGATLNDADWERAIRHGVGPDGTGLWLMPADSTAQLSDADTAALIAYLKQLPLVDNALPTKHIGLLFRGLTVANQFPLLAAERIDHAAPRPAIVTPSQTVEFGRYLSSTCAACHGGGFSGGPLDGRPEAPHAANLTAAGALSGWREEWFVKAMRTGVLPGGRQMSPEYMPWQETAQHTDNELRALWLYLKSLPPRTTGTK